MVKNNASSRLTQLVNLEESFSWSVGSSWRGDEKRQASEGSAEVFVDSPNNDVQDGRVVSFNMRQKRQDATFCYADAEAGTVGCPFARFADQSLI